MNRCLNSSRFTKINHHRPLAETSSFDPYVHETDDKPDSADDFGDGVQVDPDDSAKYKTEQRQEPVREEARRLSVYSSNAELPERGEVDAHEGEEGAEVEQLAGVLVGVADIVQAHRASKGEGADEDDVVGRRTRLGAQIAEQPFRQ